MSFLLYLKSSYGANQVFEKSPDTIKNFGIWLRYDSRSNTVNCYKEFRDLSRVNAVAQVGPLS